MTVQNTPNFVDYVGNDAQTSFPFTFRVDDVSWLSVDFTDDFDQFLLNADQEASPGGSVEYLVAPPSPGMGGPDPSFRVTRTTPQAQLLDYARYDAFDSESHESALDRLTMQIQDLDTVVAVADAALQAQITANNLLITTGLSPGHQHVIADIIDAVNLLPASTVEGSMVRWDVGANQYVATEALLGFIDNSMFITEQTVALASGAGRGQLWVRDDTPNVLMFTDDVGTDFQLGSFMLPLMLLDGEEIQFGTGNDLQMQFDGTNFLVNITSVNEFRFGAITAFYSFASNIDMLGNDIALTSGGIVQWFSAANTESVTLQHNGTNIRLSQFIGTTNGLILDDLTLYIEEGAAAEADLIAHGQVWVRSDAPNTLMFTDDTGVDYAIGGLLSDDYFKLTATQRVIGRDAGAANIADDVFIGGSGAADAMADVDFAGSIVIGVDAWSRATGATALGASVVIGRNAMLNHTSAASGTSVVIGESAAMASVADNTNQLVRSVIVGYEAGQQQADNPLSNAVLIGYRAGRCNTANGFVNANGATYIGALAGQFQQSGANNTAVGRDAMSLGAITGAENTALGAGALGNIAAGSFNTGLGLNAGLALGGNDNCTIVGNQSIDTTNVGDECTIMGAQTEGSPNADGQLILGFGAGLNIPGSDHGVFVVESRQSTGANRLSFLFGRMEVGNLVLGTAQSGPGLPINRDFGGGVPINVFKIHDTATPPTSIATAGATLWSESGLWHHFGEDNEGELYWTGVNNPAALGAGTTNNWAPSIAAATRIHFDGPAAADVTGLVAGTDGRVLVLTNDGANAIIFRDENASSTAANRFALNGDVTIGVNESLLLMYDVGISRWTSLGST